VPRNEKVEKILAAWFDLTTAADTHKASALTVLNRLLDKARTDSNLSRSDLLQALRPRFDEFYKRRITEENQFRRQFRKS
jgi:hypothetical protein